MCEGSPNRNSHKIRENQPYIHASGRRRKVQRYVAVAAESAPHKTSAADRRSLRGAATACRKVITRKDRTIRRGQTPPAAEIPASVPAVADFSLSPNAVAVASGAATASGRRRTETGVRNAISVAMGYPA